MKKWKLGALMFLVFMFAVSPSASILQAYDFEGNEEEWLNRCSTAQSSQSGAQACEAFKKYYAGQEKELKKEISSLDRQIDKIGNDKMILLTAHRRENLGEPMKNMFRAIKRIVEEFDDIQVVYPVHLNPLVRQAADEVLGDNSKVHLIEPLEVLDFHNFLNKSHIIMTDSGGIQEEAPSLGKPVLVLRDTTERPEGVNAGTLKLAGTDEEAIYKLTKELLTDKNEYDRMSKSSNPYGDGMSSKYIVDSIIKKFS